MASANIYDLLNNDEQHSKAPVAKEGPGKPDKTEQRRSVPKARGAATAVSSEPRQRVDDRDRRGGRGGAQRGGRGGGRGGYHGGESDGVHRNFDRKQGEHTKHAPGEARKHGAVGEVDPTHFSGSTSEFAAQDAANTADANGDIVGDEILDITPMAADPEDSKLSYDEYLASRQRPEDDLNRQTREVTNEGDFKAVKAIKKEEVGIFGEALSPSADAEERSAAGSKAKAKKKISLDEFVGERPAPASSGRGGFDGARGGRGGSRGGFSGEGGRGGASSGAERGGRGGARGGFDGQRGGRGGRGGFDGPSRGGRGGFDGARGGRGGARAAPAANVNLADQSAFPALSPK